MTVDVVRRNARLLHDLDQVVLLLGLQLGQLLAPLVDVDELLDRVVHGRENLRRHAGQVRGTRGRRRCDGAFLLAAAVLGSLRCPAVDDLHVLAVVPHLTPPFFAGRSARGLCVSPAEDGSWRSAPMNPEPPELPVTSRNLSSAFADSMISRARPAMAFARSTSIGLSGSLSASSVSNRWSRRSSILFFVPLMRTSD